MAKTRQIVRRDVRPLPNGPRGGLYSDQIAPSRTRSGGGGIKSRLGTRGGGIAKKVAAPSVGKWTHDLYEETQAPRRTGRTVTAAVKAGDLRLQLNSRRQKMRGGAGAGSGSAKVLDLREKLLAKQPRAAPAAGPTAAPVPAAKAQQAPPRRAVAAAAAPQAQTAAPAVPRAAPERRAGGPSKTQKSVDALLSSLGLQKYVLTFQREEVDMTALQHMTDNDLKELGVPMGPRKKIILAVKAVA